MPLCPAKGGGGGGLLALLENMGGQAPWAPPLVLPTVFPPSSVGEDRFLTQISINIYPPLPAQSHGNILTPLSQSEANHLWIIPTLIPFNGWTCLLFFWGKGEGDWIILIILAHAHRKEHSRTQKLQKKKKKSCTLCEPKKHDTWTNKSFCVKGLKEKSCLYQITRPSHDNSTVKCSTPKYMQFKTFRDWNKCQVATPALWEVNRVGIF